MFQVYNMCVHVNVNYCGLQPHTIAKGHCQSHHILLKKTNIKIVFLSDMTATS